MEILFVPFMIFGYSWSVLYTINAFVYLHKIWNSPRVKGTKLFWWLCGYFSVGIALYILLLIHFDIYWKSWKYWVPCILICLKSFFSVKVLNYSYNSVMTGHIIKEKVTVIKEVKEIKNDTSSSNN